MKLYLGTAEAEIWSKTVIPLLALNATDVTNAVSVFCSNILIMHGFPGKGANRRTNAEQ